MKLKKTLLVATILTSAVGFSCLSANAQSRGDIESYQSSLDKRISHGQRNGKLTPNEVARLRSQYQKIENMQRQFNRGRLNPQERSRLMGLLTNLDKQITNQLHDDDRSHWRDWDDRRGDWRRTQNWQWKDDWRGGGRNDNRGSWNNNNNRGWNNKNNRGYDPKNKSWKNRGFNPAQDRPVEPPRWMVSRDGGYYDATGNVQGTVSGADLYQYGGTMGDGSGLPGPGAAVNAQGHLIR